jgi:hypothetical protein
MPLKVKLSLGLFMAPPSWRADHDTSTVLGLRAAAAPARLVQVGRECELRDNSEPG